MAISLPPPTGDSHTPPTDVTVWGKLFGWFYLLWKSVTGMTFGADPTSYSNAILSTAGQSDMGAQTVLGPTVAMRAGNSSGQSIPANVSTTVTNWTTAVDTAGAFSASTGVYTIPIAGTYIVHCNILIDNNTTGSLYIYRIFQNAANIATFGVPYNAAGTAYGPISGSTVLVAKAGDTVSLQISQNSAGARTLYAGGPADAQTWTNFSIVKVD